MCVIIPANMPLGLFESSAAASMSNDEPMATAPMTVATMKRRARFHCSGMGLGLTTSYPMDIRAPSLSNVMSISMSTSTSMSMSNRSNSSAALVKLTPVCCVPIV